MLGNNGDFLADEALDISEVSTLLCVTKRYRLSARACSPSTTDTVYIGLRLIWEVVVDDEREAVYIDPSSGDISRYEYPYFSILKSSECSLSRIL